jgi:hypothetical protein
MFTGQQLENVNKSTNYFFYKKIIFYMSLPVVQKTFGKFG